MIAAAVAAAGLDAIQLHGAEDPARAAQLRARFGLPVWKALSVAGPDDTARAHAYAGAADLVLFDAKTPKGTLPGGSERRKSTLSRSARWPASPSRLNWYSWPSAGW